VIRLSSQAAPSISPRPLSAATKPKKSRAAYGSGSVRKEKQASGRVVWIGQFYIAGKQRQRTLGPASGLDGMSTRAARRALEAVRAELETAEAQRAATDESGTLRAVAEEHHRHLEGEIRGSTLTDYRGYLNRHLLPFFGDVPLDSIRVRDIEDFVRHQRTEVKQHRLNKDGSPKVGLAGSTIVNHINYLHSIFEFALRREIVTSNPVSPAKKPKVKKQDQDFSFLTVDRVDAVIDAVADDYLGSTDRALILTATHTGLRQGELIALRWEDILWDQAAVRVRASVSRGSIGDPKSVTSKREVPMSRRVAEVLRQRRETLPRRWPTSSGAEPFRDREPSTPCCSVTFHGGPERHSRRCGSGIGRGPWRWPKKSLRWHANATIRGRSERRFAPWVSFATENLRRSMSSARRSSATGCPGRGSSSPGRSRNSGPRSADRGRARSPAHLCAKRWTSPAGAAPSWQRSEPKRNCEPRVPAQES